MPDYLSARTSKSIFNLKYTLTFILDLIPGLIEPQGSMKQLLFNCGLYTNSSEWALGGRWRGPAEPHFTCSVYKGCWIYNIASGEPGAASSCAHIWRGARCVCLCCRAVMESLRDRPAPSGLRLGVSPRGSCSSKSSR